MLSFLNWTQLKIKPYFYSFLVKANNVLLTLYSHGDKIHISNKQTKATQNKKNKEKEKSWSHNLAARERIQGKGQAWSSHRPEVSRHVSWTLTSAAADTAWNKRRTLRASMFQKVRWANSWTSDATSRHKTHCANSTNIKVSWCDTIPQHHWH